MLNLAAAVERADEFDIIHYEAAYYPMSLAFARLSPTPIVQTLHHSPSQAEIGSVVALSRGAVRRHLRASRRGCWTALNVVGTVLHGIDTDALRLPRDSRTTTCCFSAASPKARACCRRSRWRGASGMRLILAAAEERLLSRARRSATWTASTIVYCRRGGLRGQGRSFSAARARCSTRCRRASRSGWCSPKRWPAARRSPRSTAARCARSWTTGVTGCVFESARRRWWRACRACSRSIAGASASARSRASACDRMVDELRQTSYRRVVGGHGAAAVAIASPVSPAGRCSPSSRIPTTNRWRAAGRWRGWPTPASRVVLLCASRGERGSVSDPALVARRAISARARRRAARGGARCSASPRSSCCDHPDGDLRWARRPELHAEIVAAIARYRPDAVITFGEDGLYWHLDHIGVHERTDDAVRTLGAAAPPLYYVTMPRGMMRAVVDAALAAGLVAAAVRASGASVPDAFGLARAAADRSIVDVRDWVPRKLAATCCHRTQMGAGQPVRQHRRRRCASGCSASSSFAVRGDVPAGVLELIAAAETA